MKKDMAAFAAPPEYNLKVDFKKICWEVMEGWIMQRVTELLRGVEDEVLVGTILESLKDVRERSLSLPVCFFHCLVGRVSFNGPCCAEGRSQAERHAPRLGAISGQQHDTVCQGTSWPTTCSVQLLTHITRQ